MAFKQSVDCVVDASDSISPIIIIHRPNCRIIARTGKSLLTYARARAELPDFRLQIQRRATKLRPLMSWILEFCKRGCCRCQNRQRYDDLAEQLLADIPPIVTLGLVMDLDLAVHLRHGIQYNVILLSRLVVRERTASQPGHKRDSR